MPMPRLAAMGLGLARDPCLNLGAEVGNLGDGLIQRSRLLGTEMDTQKGRQEHRGQDGDKTEGQDSDGQPEEHFLHREAVYPTLAQVAILIV